MPRPRAAASPFRYVKTSPELIRLAVFLYVKNPLSLRNVEDLLAERGIEISQERLCATGGIGSDHCLRATSSAAGQPRARHASLALAPRRDVREGER